MGNLQNHQATFDQWISDHAAILHHVAHGFAGGPDWHDLMQELLMAVWKAVPAFRGESSPATFLYRVAHHAALTWKRGQKNYERRLRAWQLGPQWQEAVQEPHRSDPRLEQLYQCIRRLPALDRSLLLLSLDELDHRTIAAIHGLSENNVGVRLHRSRQQLTQWMRPSGDGAPIHKATTPTPLSEHADPVAVPVQRGAGPGPVRP